MDNTERGSQGPIHNEWALFSSEIHSYNFCSRGKPSLICQNYLALQTSPSHCIKKCLYNHFCQTVVFLLSMSHCITTGKHYWKQKTWNIKYYVYHVIEHTICTYIWFNNSAYRNPVTIDEKGYLLILSCRNIGAMPLFLFLFIYLLVM